MNEGTAKVWLIAVLLISVATAPARAGEFQLSSRLGVTEASIDGDSLTSGEGRDDKLMHSALTASYRWTVGPLVEVGWSGSSQLFFSATELRQNWVGAGWQFDPYANWKITPKLGLTFSRLTSDSNIFSTKDPVDKLNDTVPYAKAHCGIQVLPQVRPRTVRTSQLRGLGQLHILRRGHLLDFRGKELNHRAPATSGTPASCPCTAASETARPRDT
jgi:hypothetical protein